MPVKRILLLITGVLIVGQSFCQSVSINNTGALSHSSAMLDISSNSKGLLIPRMRTVERNLVLNPAEGLLVYDVDSKSFWYYNAGWQEILNSNASFTPTGFAGGDLSGTYPTPNVVKLQGQDVAAVVPLDKQSLKWDMLNNRWQAQNDSLFLPYNVSSAIAGKLLGIINLNTAPASSALYGKITNAGSGIDLAESVGVWGDNNAGFGLVGTSNSSRGVYGASLQSDGVSGFSSGNGYAGVYGFNNAAGFGVMGEMQAAGVAVYGKNTGQFGRAAFFESINSVSTSPTVHALQYGMGNGINIVLANGSSTADGLNINVSGSATGIFSHANAGRAAFFENATAGSTAEVLKVANAGQGNAAKFSNDNSSNAVAAVSVVNTGKGYGIETTNSNVASTAASIYAVSLGTNGINSYAAGNAIYGFSTATSAGVGIWGQAAAGSTTGIGVKGVSNSTTQNIGSVTGVNNSITGVGVYGTSNGADGIGVKGEVTGSTAIAGYFESQNNRAVAAVSYSASQFQAALTATNFGNGHGLMGLAGDLGYGVYGGTGLGGTTNGAGFFEISNANNTVDAVKINTAGLGGSLNIKSSNALNSVTMLRVTKSGFGDFMVFENGTGINKIRFDNTGKGFFNGGTQTGGADMAELFDVTNVPTAYEPGDVLVISVDRDRTVEKSSAPYSDLVAGVYATKPGILMTEENIDADISGKVPMGVVGVIPTKVCLEGGAIKRGDFLVTSSMAGVAMKADPLKLRPGQIIGKALENFNTVSMGKIRVLVNVK